MLVAVTDTIHAKLGLTQYGKVFYYFFLTMPLYFVYCDLILLFWKDLYLKSVCFRLRYKEHLLIAISPALKAAERRQVHISLRRRGSRVGAQTLLTCIGLWKVRVPAVYSLILVVSWAWGPWPQMHFPTSYFFHFINGTVKGQTDYVTACPEWHGERAVEQGIRHWRESPETTAITDIFESITGSD